MSKAIPSKPPIRPFQPAYALTTTTRVPGRSGGANRTKGAGLTGPTGPGPDPSDGAPLA